MIIINHRLDKMFTTFVLFTLICQVIVLSSAEILCANSTIYSAPNVQFHLVLVVIKNEKDLDCYLATEGNKSGIPDRAYFVE